MRKRSAESNLPSKLDVTQVPSVNPEVTKNVNAFLENIRKVIGYPIELVGYDPLFGEADYPIFDVSLIDFEHLPYADHLSYIYNFYFQRGRLFEAQETLSEFQELLLGQFSYLFLSINIAGHVYTLRSIHEYFEEIAKQYGMIYSSNKIKVTKDLPITVAPFISEPHVLKSTFIFGDT